MASTTAYTDGFVINNQPNGTYGPFTLAGGVYGVAAVLPATGTALVQTTGPDGTTQVTAFTPTTGVVSYGSPVYLKPGQYQVVFGVAGPSSLSVSRIKLA